MDAKHAQELVNHLLEIRDRRKPRWRELAKWLCPYRGLLEDRQVDRPREDLARFTNAASQACLRGASGMTSGMTPRNIAWFKPVFTDERLAEVSGAREWLDRLDARIRDTLTAGGFYQAIQQFNTDLLWAGCAMLYTERTPKHVLRYECLQVGTYCVGMDYLGNLEIVARRLVMNPNQMAELFGKDALSEVMQSKIEKRPYDEVYIWHLMRDTHQGQKPVESLYWQDGDTEKFLRKSFYHEMPCFFTCWNDGITPYGTGPGDECLADARQMDILERRKLEGLAKLVNPPVTAPPSLKDIIDLSPGGINYATSQQGITPLYNLNSYATALPYLQKEIMTVSERLEAGLMATIFASVPMNQRPRDMSATEFLERKREALQQLGPVISAYEPNVLTPLLFRTAQTLDRAGLTPVLPEQMQGMPIMMKMDFISPMANALRQTGAETTRAFFQDVANMFRYTQNSEILDKIDMDQMVDELATGLGVPGSVVRADADVENIRKMRAEAQAQQNQNMQRMQQAQTEMTEANAMTAMQQVQEQDEEQENF